MALQRVQHRGAQGSARVSFSFSFSCCVQGYHDIVNTKVASAIAKLEEVGLTPACCDKFLKTYGKVSGETGRRQEAGGRRQEAGAGGRRQEAGV